jgi:hypothetical protein
MTPEKKRAVKSYLNTLGPKLREKYGRRKYSTDEVYETACDLALEIDYVCFAYMLYCSEEDFSRLHAAAGEVCDAAVMRQAVADEFFGGHAEFDTIALADGLWGGVVSVVETGDQVTVSVVRTSSEVAVNLATVGTETAVTVLSSGVSTVAEGAGTVFGWLSDVDWSGVLDAS